MNRKQGRIFVRVPKEEIPRFVGTELIELTKCVYGLSDPPRKWWLAFSRTLTSLNLKSSARDPGVFWFSIGCASC